MKKIVPILIVVLIVIQFFKPEKNNSGNTNINNIPEDVKADLKVACYDCHSNETVYPWYSSIQPLAWWLNRHITEGKKELNFDVALTPRKYKHIVEVIQENEMPLKSYTIIHRDAVLNATQKDRIIKWASANQ